jgi:hypothetical protein
MMSSAAEHVGSSHDDKRLPARHDKTRIEVDQKRRFRLRSAVASLQSGKRSALNPAHPLHSAQVLLLRRNEYQARAGASRLIDECTQAFLGDATFEKSGVGRKAALWDNTFIRLVRRFQSRLPRYSRSVSVRPAASSIVLSQLLACAGTPASATTWLAHNSRTNSTVFHVSPRTQVAPTWDQ